MKGSAHDVLRLIHEPRSLRKRPVSSDPRSRLQTLKFVKRHKDLREAEQASGCLLFQVPTFLEDLEKQLDETNWSRPAPDTKGHYVFLAGYFEKPSGNLALISYQSHQKSATGPGGPLYCKAKTQNRMPSVSNSNPNLPQNAFASWWTPSGVTSDAVPIQSSLSRGY